MSTSVCRCMLLIAVYGGATGLSGNTISLSAFSNEPLESGSSSCQITGSGQLSCSISPTFSDVSGRHVGHVDASGHADFGAISGGVFVFNDNAFVGGAYQVSFSDFLTVLGGSGEGMLITHYHLVSSDEQDRLPGFAQAPFYRFVQGSVYVDFRPAMPSDPPVTFTREDDIDVAAPIIFGNPLPLGAGSQIELVPSDGSRGGLWTSGSAQITGYTVLDGSGAEVSNFSVQRSFSTNPPDVFIPEPSTLWSSAGGALLLVAIVCKRSVV